MNTQAKINFIKSHKEHYGALTINVNTYASNLVASFNKVLTNGVLQFTGWDGNKDGVWNIDLSNNDRLDSLYDQMHTLVYGA